MKQSLTRAVGWIIREANATPRRAMLTRFVLPLAIVACIFALIPHTPLDGPVGGVFALTTVVVCCWFGGLVPALFMPLTVWLASRFPFDDPTRVLLPSARELMTFFGLTMLTGAVGLAGQYRRQFQAASRAHDAQLREQSRALAAARIIFRNLDGRVTTWNEGAEQLYGWTAGEAVGQLIHELLCTECPSSLEAVREVLLRDGQWRGEVTQFSKAGERLNVTTHCILYLADGDGPPGVAEVHTDVTELRCAEQAIRESDRRKDLFVSTLAHELRNPLAPLRSGLEILRMTRAGSAEDADTLEIMRRQLEHVVRMVDDLLDVGRINTGKVQIRRAPVLLGDIVRDAVEACRPQIVEAGHKLVVTLPDDEVWLHADAARLVQVLMNLLGNAAKFTDPSGDIRLSVDRSGEHVSIRVTDTGVGIAAESLPHVFDMFAQAEDANSRFRGGLGLGLNIVRTLVEMHGGTVEARSDGPGRGAEFEVRLPMATNHVADNSGDLHEGAARSYKPKQTRALVVDDNVDAARMLQLMLTKSGLDCRCVFDGPSAIAEAAVFDPHVAILDLGMPGMDGLELARQLRASRRHPHLLLIALTGWDQEDDRRRSREAGFDHHLAKPVSFEVLLGLIASRGDHMKAGTTTDALSLGREPAHRAVRETQDDRHSL